MAFWLWWGQIHYSGHWKGCAFANIYCTFRARIAQKVFFLGLHLPIYICPHQNHLVRVIKTTGILLFFFPCLLDSAEMSLTQDSFCSAEHAVYTVTILAFSMSVCLIYFSPCLFRWPERSVVRSPGSSVTLSRRRWSSSPPTRSASPSPRNGASQSRKLSATKRTSILRRSFLLRLNFICVIVEKPDHKFLHNDKFTFYLYRCTYLPCISSFKGVLLLYI